MGRIQVSEPSESPSPGHNVVGSYPQNVATAPSLSVGRSWNSGLFDCHNDPTNAVMTAFFPCVAFGQIAEVMDAIEPSQGSSKLNCTSGSVVYMLTMIVCFNCYIGSKYRSKLRRKFGLVEAPYDDAVSHFFCPFCSLCQEFRELKSRQLDPALGWNGILAKQQEMMQYGTEQMNKAPQPQAMSK
ncbi:protein PLANT CADMIUM RESISTANCE 8-like [Andrographis paniculata]|uniref:protein PLANT CADMIUM RESISTANCE 8-like n=1 Tax=Andrographis paniculata TaxID=175694 RepID=UPI0021E8890C|nr:protein PLANT CADMIUM RESISTANCE 8-like [Andrographis paniculata]